MKYVVFRRSLVRYYSSNLFSTETYLFRGRNAARFVLNRPSLVAVVVVAITLKAKQSTGFSQRMNGNNNSDSSSNNCNNNNKNEKNRNKQSRRPSTRWSFFVVTFRRKSDSLPLHLHFHLRRRHAILRRIDCRGPPGL